MNKKLFSVSKILSSFEKIWFSDFIMGLFIIFPTGMWTMMVLIACVSLLTQPLLHAIAMILFLIGATLTVFLGYKRSIKKDRESKKDSVDN